MANTCPGQIQACAMRVARLDTNGVPSPGADNLVVTDSLVTMEFTPVYAEGDEFEVKNACGDVCLTFKDDDRFKRVDISSLDICELDPELFELLGGGDVLTDGEAVGYASPEVDGVSNAVSLELWAKRIVDGEQEDLFPYEWWVFPRVRLRWTARTFNNGPMSHPFQGRGTENPNWADGPANDWPVASDRVFQHIPTTSIPTTSCGYQELVAS